MSSLDPAALEALREIGGDEFVLELADAFFDEAPTLLASLRASDPEEVRRAAHTLKSNGQTFGAKAFAEDCRALEELAKGGDLAGAGDLADRIDQGFAQLREELAALGAATD